MSAAKVCDEATLTARLLEAGCTDTGQKTNTGKVWKAASGRHFLVPFSLDGFYPDWMLEDLSGVVGKLDPFKGKFIGAAPVIALRVVKDAS